MEALVKQFMRIGAVLEINERDQRLPYMLDIQSERFVIYKRGDAKADITAPDVRPDLRHLLLNVKQVTEAGNVSQDKFLCGHDERHWFLAGIDPRKRVINVREAMEALKPLPVLDRLKREGVREKERNLRRNAAFLRQGEWFFIPEPDFIVRDKSLIERNILARPGGKAHVVDEVVRFNGAVVYVRGKQMLTEKQWLALQKRDAKKAAQFEQHRMNPSVYARGKVRHPDHKTIELKVWHRVFANEERSFGSSGSLGTGPMLWYD